MKPIQSENDLMPLYRATQAYAVLVAWAANGLFDVLASSGPVPLDNLPGDSRALSQTASVLCLLGVIRVENQVYSLTDVGRQLYEAGALNLERNMNVLPDLSRLNAVLENGGPVLDANGNSRATEGGVRETDRQGTQAFMDMLYRKSGDSAAIVAQWLTERLDPVASVLDLGGGHGRYGMQLVGRGLYVTLFDRPVCVDIARDRFGGAMDYIEGDFYTDDLGGPYECIVMSNIIHGLGPMELDSLLARSASAMSPGGILLIKDMFINEGNDGPVEAACFDVTMLLYTRQGQCYRLSELDPLLEKNGLQRTEFEEIPDHSFSLLAATKV